MHIQAYQLEFQGQRDYSRVEREQLHAEITASNDASQIGHTATASSSRSVDADNSVTYSADGETKQKPFYIPPAPVMISTASRPMTEKGMEISPEDRLRIEIINRLHQAMTGKSLSIIGLGKITEGTEATDSAMAEPSTQPASGTAAADAGLRIELTRRYTAQEQEHTSFAARGTILTADGRRIELDLQLEMSRSAETHQRQRLTLGGRLHDPLVINFDGGSAELRNARYEFDLDADGETEMIPGLRGDRAFIALDKNGDGIINDGSELFGATTGNGFAELATYDTDGNGFIDAGDEVFDQLKLWVPGADGGQLFDMSTRDVGALHVSGTATEFSISSDFTENRLGVIRSTSIFLSESGRSGTVQHVDLSV